MRITYFTALLHVAVEVDEKADRFLLAAGSAADEFLQFRARRQGWPDRAQIARPAPRRSGKGTRSAAVSRKKSKGLMTVSSATRSTSTSKSRVFSGNTSRARKLPCGSCCQLRKCCSGFDSQRVATAPACGNAAPAAAAPLAARGSRAVVMVAGTMVQGDADGHRGCFSLVVAAAKLNVAQDRPNGNFPVLFPFL